MKTRGARNLFHVFQSDDNLIARNEIPHSKDSK
jgi:hypothetical protein